MKRLQFFIILLCLTIMATIVVWLYGQMDAEPTLDESSVILYHCDNAVCEDVLTHFLDHEACK